MKSSTDFQEMRNRAAKSAVPFLGIYPKEVKSTYEGDPAISCLRQHYSQHPRHRINTGYHQQIRKMYTHTLSH